MAAGAYDLTTVAAVKLWLGIPDSQTGSDVKIQALVTSASRWLLNYISRGNILSTTYTDRFTASGWGQTSLLLPRWPVTSVSALSIGQTAIPASVAPGPGNTPNGYLLEPWDGIPAGTLQSINLYGYAFGGGPQGISVTYVAGYLVSSEAATVPAATAYTVTVAAPYGPWAADSGVVLVSSGAALTKVASAPAAGQYSVAAGGIYTFNAAQASAAVLISYSFIPADLSEACAEMVGERVSYSGRIGQASKTLGGQETITFSQKDITAANASMLQNYRNVVPFA